MDSNHRWTLADSRGVRFLPRVTATALVLLVSASVSLAQTTAGPAAPKANLANLVFAGDSLTAGYQNSHLSLEGQSHGYANLIATQAGVDLKVPYLSGDFPIITAGPYPSVVGLPPVTRLSPGDLTRLVAVPGYTLGAFAGFAPAPQAPCPPNPMISDPAGVPGPVVYMAYLVLNPACSTPFTAAETAALRKPSTAIVWIGSNDALFPMLFLNMELTPAFPPSPAPQDIARSFLGQYVTAMQPIRLASGTTVVATIPDVTLLPYLTSAEALAARTGLPLAVLGLNAGDMVTPYAFPLLDAQNVPLPEVDLTAGAPVVIRRARIQAIRAAVRDYNYIVQAYAALTRSTVVDIHALVDDLAKSGVVVNGRKLTTAFMGGLFSLDGIHPTNTGYAIIANEFIKTMNRQLAAGIPPVSVARVAETDPMIFADTGKSGRNTRVPTAMADALRSALSK